jgi:hypothetical protein
MTMLTMSGQSASGSRLVVSSKPKEIYQIFQEFTGQVKIDLGEIRRSAVSREEPSKLIRAVDGLLELIDKYDRDAARAMDAEPELDFIPVA